MNRWIVWETKEIVERKGRWDEPTVAKVLQRQRGNSHAEVEDESGEQHAAMCAHSFHRNISFIEDGVSCIRKSKCRKFELVDFD